ncbi:MAG TPA: hypothetical protein VF519_07065 [Mycobacteriales bacterium]|jgi:hypothetical protein
MTRPLALAALAAAAFVPVLPAAQADPLVPETCHYWTDYGFCTPEVANPLDKIDLHVQQHCFYWTDYPFCIPPR